MKLLDGKITYNEILTTSYSLLYGIKSRIAEANEEESKEQINKTVNQYQLRPTDIPDEYKK